ncbi:MAG: hypothetical protein COB76_07015 [Alphaproteobacteria bacterium]|nr:MAG: hypothetical protein COB76_07015 [Alphaproteobacteria bacterium]
MKKKLSLAAATLGLAIAAAQPVLANDKEKGALEVSATQVKTTVVNEQSRTTNVSAKVTQRVGSKVKIFIHHGRSNTTSTHGNSSQTSTGGGFKITW